MSETLFDKGLKVRREVLGADYVEKSFASADDSSGTAGRVAALEAT